jgi:hypothetical protein
MKRTGSFQATGDDGKKYTVLIYQQYLDASSSEGSDVTEGMTELRLSDGRKVSRINKGQYKAIGFPELRLRSDSPDAP